MVTLPIVHGESVVMRILDKSNVTISLDALGMREHDRQRFQKAIGQSHGAVLVTGPTGSGKTTTLYAALGELNTPDKTLITIEDPVEYQLAGVKQIQVNAKVNLTFATGLRSMLRSDPNVIMVGEIRDRDTAQIAVESALTGHLVLSTLHTNDAPSAITRLVEMGIEPFLVASSIECVVAQRLARTLCTRLPPVEAEISMETLIENGFVATGRITAYEAHGLPALRRHRLQGSYRPLRDDADDRRDPRAHARARLGRGDHRDGDLPGHASAARRRPRQDQSGPHDRPRGRARHRLARSPATEAGAARPGQSV